MRPTTRTRSSPSPGPTSTPARPASCSTRPAGRTRAGPACASTPAWRPRSPARSRSRSPAACTPATWRTRCSRSRRSAWTSPRARTRPARRDGARTRTPLRVAVFTKRARDARRHRPNVAFGPTPVHAGLLEADGAGRWGKERDFGGRYVPETLVAALEQLEAAYAAVRHDPRFWAELDDLLVHYVGRPTPLYRADRLAADARVEAALQSGERGRKVPQIPRDPALPQARGPRAHGRPQDQQRARPGAADPAAGQDPGDRRDRRRPARRRDGDRVRAARPAVRGVHGRGGHPAPGAERAPDARPRRRGPLGHVRHGHAQGRRQRGDARLGDQRRVDALRPRVGDGAAPVPHDRPRPPAADRRRGGGAAVRGRGAAAGPRPRLRRRRLERDRAPVAVHRRALGPARGGGGGRRWRGDRTPCGGDRGRHPGDPARVAVADAPGPRRPGRRGALGVGRARLPGRRAAAGGAGRGRPPRGRDRDRPRGRGGDAGGDPRRGHPAGARDGARGRRAAQAAGRPRGLGRRRSPTTRSSCSASPAAATRTWPRSSGSPTSGRGTSTDDDRRAARLLPVAARDAREGDLGRRRARGRRHVPGQGQDLPDHGPGRRRRDASARRSSSRPT